MARCARCSMHDLTPRTGPYHSKCQHWLVHFEKDRGRMHVTDRSKTVVMLIDWDNLQICHSRDAPGTELDLQALIALAQSYGTLVSARAYAEWNLLSERLAVYKAGIEPVFAPVMRPEGSPREGKSLADT